MTSHAGGTGQPTAESDVRRLGRWLAIVGVVFLLLAVLAVLAMVFLGSHSMATRN
jgi:Tfp pilus assembly protein PilO